jgi:putative transcriptional regulator
MALDFNIFKIEYNKVAPKKGSVLVSEPFLQDTYFKRSLVLLTEHSKDGAVGFVINKPLDVKFNEVMNNFPNFNAVVSIGGPVSTNTVHYLHNVGDLIPNSIRIMDNIYWGGDFEAIKGLIISGNLFPSQIRFFLGYSGWQAGQLENELSQNSWLVTEIKSTQIMKPHINLWKNTLTQLGEKYKIWANFPENPGYN